jgi:hypothetical protein
VQEEPVLLDHRSGQSDLSAGLKMHV